MDRIPTPQTPDWIPSPEGYPCPDCHGTGLEADPGRRGSSRCLRCRDGSADELDCSECGAALDLKSDPFHVCPQEAEWCERREHGGYQWNQARPVYALCGVCAKDEGLHLPECFDTAREVA